MSEPIEAPPKGGESLNPGSRLHHEREKRGMSLFETAESLHLDTWVIEALENNRFDAVGPPVYAKGHLKQYALLLGLPPAEVLSAYEGLRQDVAPPPAVQQSRIFDRASASKSPLVIAALILSLGVVIGALIWRLPWHRSVAKAGAAAATMAASQGTAPPATPAAPAQTAGQAVVSPPGSAPAVSSAAGVGAQPETAGATASVGRVRLRLSFSTGSWVDVRESNGATLFRGQGAANSVKVVTGMAPLTVYLGYAGGVQMQINNHAVSIGPQFVHGDVARFEAGADGQLRRGPRS